MEKAKIAFENEDGSKRITVEFTDRPGKGITVDVDYGPEGMPGHKDGGLYLAIANDYINQFR